MEKSPLILIVQPVCVATDPNLPGPTTGALYTELENPNVRYFHAHGPQLNDPAVIEHYTRNDWLHRPHVLLPALHVDRAQWDAFHKIGKF